jgi:CxxC motif-containing protein (DUF1111 family)
MKRPSIRTAIATAILAWLAVSCGMMTTAPDPADVLDGPLDGLSPGELAAFAEGDEQFERPFAAADGLGPIFNNVSCALCHSGDGRGRPENILVRFSRGTDLLEDEGGPQLQDRAIPGAEPERLPDGCDVSRRLPPPVFGVGLLEAIPEAAILALADPTDVNGDGISGRAHMVTPPEFVPAHEPGGGAGPRVGRFGRKAQVSSLLHQVVAAYHQDMGVTTDFIPEENRNPLAGDGTQVADRVPDPELSASVVRAVVTYVRMLAPPAPGALDDRRRNGQQVFADIGCASCHVPAFVAGPSPVPSIAGREVHAYTDLLLHDMGDELADYRSDGAADGREWRTAPLWGLRVMKDFLDGQMFLLHDGRAHSVADAIRHHGGEAAASRAAFDALSSADRDALLDFVESR